MQMGINRLSPLAGVCLGVAMLMGCGADTTNSSADSGGAGSCTFTIKFQGRAYTAASTDAPVQQGRKLGLANVVPCPGDVDGPPDESLTIFAVVGQPPSEAVFGVPNVGLMRRSELEEDRQ